MRQNVLKFKNDIKALVAKQKETGYAGKWMHPIYCAYYMLKHKVENRDEYVKEEIDRSYKALADTYAQGLFKQKVDNIYNEYATEDETVCTDR
jgi:hypothetical protein